MSPELNWAQSLHLAVPGTYRPGPAEETVRIQQVWTRVDVISSKQRPRRMTMLGSNGTLYRFLLKGHEDLRQDERVMQLFGLINVCLDNDRSAKARGLSIVRYSVLPLSNNSGLIGWVENCDTISQLIKQYRESKGIPLNVEQHMIDNKAPDYAQLPLMHKVEVFCSTMSDTVGQDVAKVLWLKSKTAEVWIERRTNYTRSLAVMSMVGYILGLGDRHLANLMLDRVSGKVVHIDFGDCFEVSQQRAKYPEMVPFRLTRMLIKAMESSDTQGTFQSTAEKVMHVLRYNGDSVMAMLEAFVYDPLISWKLLTTHKTAATTGTGVSEGGGGGGGEEAAVPGGEGGGRGKEDGASGAVSTVPGIEAVLAGDSGGGAGALTPSLRTGLPVRPATGVPDGAGGGGADNNDDDPLEDLNTRALEVINRIQAKLTGRDFIDVADENEDEEDRDMDGEDEDEGEGEEEEGENMGGQRTQTNKRTTTTKNNNNKKKKTGKKKRTTSRPQRNLTVEMQVGRLIAEATSVENLCQLYPGWCPWW